MATQLTWKKELLRGFYTIYKDGTKVGALKDSSFSQTAWGELYGISYIFKTKSFLSHDIEIIEEESQKIIGTITYRGLGTKATINLEGRVFQWKSESLWNTKWGTTDEAGLSTRYSGSFTSGQIDTNANDAVVLLAGLLIPNYYWQLSFVIFIVLITIIAW